MTEGTVAAQFQTILPAAQDCDVLVGATSLQIAAPSIAEKLGIPYLFAVFCPTVLPSAHHPPPLFGVLGDAPAPSKTEYPALWARDAARFDALFGAALDAHRGALGLPPVTDVRSHVFTRRPLLAADPTLGPWPEPADDSVVQTGAWILRDERPLAPELEAFLAAGEPPVYFGFGSVRAPVDLARTMIASARAHGRRAVVLRGWAELALVDDAPDCLAIGEVNQQALFTRVTAVVHHGGAGTTTAAARAGAPQVVIPQHFDQHYWAGRVRELGIGAAHAAGAPTVESLTAGLGHALEPEVAARAREVAARVRSDGAEVAARTVIAAARETAR